MISKLLKYLRNYEVWRLLDLEINEARWELHGFVPSGLRMYRSTLGITWFCALWTSKLLKYATKMQTLRFLDFECIEAREEL